MKTVLPRAIYNAFISRLGVLLLFLASFHSLSFGQASCATAAQLIPAAACAPVAGTAFGAVSSGVAAPAACTGTVSYDLWYYFQATSTNPTITLAVTGARFLLPKIQILSGTCGALANVTCQTGAGSLVTAGLTIGNIYYVRLYSTSPTLPTNAGNGAYTVCVVGPPPPANDDCANAVTLTTGTTSVGSVINATPSTGAPALCTGTSKYDVWYKFVAGSTNPQIALTGVGANFTSSGIQLLSGTCGSQTSVACNATNIAATGLTIGSTYYVRVYSNGAATAPTTAGGFSLTFTDPPANDLCAAAISITSGTACTNTTGTVVNATLTAGSSTACATATYDVWYSFVAQSVSPRITLSAQQANFTNSNIQLFSGSCAALTSIGCGTAGIINATGLTVGTTYYIRVYSTTAGAAPTTNGGFSLCVVDPPANDLCTGAVTLTSGTSCTNTAGTIEYSTVSAGASTACATATYDVWYSFVAQTTNPVITLSGQQASFTNSNIQLFSGTCAALTSIGCGTAGILNSTGLTVGATYYVRVYSTTAGTSPTVNGDFNICVVDPPANDLCANAITLTPGTSCANTAGNVISATLTAGTPAACSGTVLYDVWYKFVASAVNPIITLSGQGANFTNSNVQLFSGTCAGLTSLGCGTAGVMNATGLTIGTTYYVRVYSTSVGTAPTTLAGFNICVVNPPSNDLCAGAITLTPGTACTNTTGVIENATLTAGDPGVCSGTVTYDVWYKFVATATAPTITLSGLGVNFTNANIQILSGACGSLGSLGCGTGGIINATGLTVGTTYYIRVYSTTVGTAPSSSGGFSICVVSPPTNDDCAGAPTITSNTTTCVNTAGTVNYATASTGVPGPCTGTVKYDVWYKFVAQSTSPRITLSGLGANFPNSNIQLMSGACGGFASLACGTGGVINATGLTIGTTYFIRVYSTAATAAPTTLGDFSLCVTDPPANDDCAGAITLTPGASCSATTGSVNYSTLSTGVPAVCTGTAIYDVWYKFVATSTNPSINLGGLGVNFTGSSIQLLSGACGSLTSIACGATTIAATGLTIGTTYYVRVYSTSAGTSPTTNGDFTICVVDPPANDLCANAVLLTSSNNCTTTSGTVVNATFTAGVTAGCAGTVTFDVWYKFVAQSTYPTITLSSIGANFTSPAIQIFSGACGTLVPLTCGGSSLVTTALTVGTTYYVRVYSTSGAAPTSLGTFNICITDPPANDDCATAVTLTSGTSCSTTAGTIVSANLSTAPAPSCGTPTSDVWYKFIAQTTNPTITLGSLGTNFTSPGTQILSGACGTLTEVDCGLGASNPVSGLTVGNTYYVRVFSTTAVINSNGTFTICVTDPTPANDDCAGAVTLVSGTSCTNTAGNMVGATLTGGVVAPTCGTPLYDVWYKFVAQTTNPTISLSSLGANFINQHMELMSGACGSLANVACSATSTLVASGLTIGNTYYVRVYSTTAVPTSAGTFNICVTDPPPANDDCAGAVALTSGSTCVTTTGNTVGATLTSGITAPTCGTPVFDIWYSFTAQSTNPTITISGNTNFINPHIQLLSGACGSLANVTCSTTGALTASGLTIGTVYYVRVYSTSAAPTTAGAFAICVTDPAPANDDCAGAVTLTSGTSCVNTAGNMVGATLTGGVVAPTCGTPLYDVWYKFTAQTTNPTITISGNTNFANPHIELMSGACGSLANLACVAGTSLVASGLTIGTTYYVRVYSTTAVPTTAGSFNICITDPAPANDDCAGAVTLTSGASCVNTVGNMVGATLTGSVVAPTCGTPLYDVWYTFTAQTTNPTITISGNTNFANPHIELMSGTCGSLANVACVAGNSLVASGLTIGTIYYVRVYSTTAVPTTAGSFNICITDPAPANDDCAGAVTLTSGTGCVNTAGNMVGATLTTGVVAPTCGTPLYDVWYKFTAQTTNPTITISGNTNFANPHIELMSGACGSLANVACVAGTSLVASGLTIGTTYYVRVYSTSAVPTTAGSFNICITDPAPANDDCAGAVALTSGTSCVNTIGNTIGATLTSGIPVPSCGTPVFDVWYSFVAQVTNPTITISGNTNFINPGIQLLSGACGSLATVSCVTGSSLTASGLTIGNTYYVRIYSTSAAPTTAGSFNICITNPAPANDDCAGAVTLTSGTSCVNTAGNVVGATLTSGVVAPTCGTPLYDVWYKFVAQSVNPTITLSSLGVNFTNPHIELMSGACGSLANVTCVAGTALTGSALTIGNTYYVRVYSTTAVPATAGSFNICITDPAPANDDCAGAVTLTSGSSCVNVIGNTIGATLTSGIPVPTCGTPVFDIFYKFVAQTTNPTITISGNTNFINPGIQLLSGACGSLATISCVTGSSLTASGLTVGTTYYVRVYSTSAAPTTAGSFNICITDPAPANDDCAGAVTLTSGTSCVNTTGNMVGATLTSGVVAPTCGTPLYDVWYKFVAQSVNPTITLSSLGANFINPHIELMSGACGSLANVTCVAGTALTGSALTIGNTYYVRVYSTTAVPAAAGTFNICITDPVVANDNCAGAISLTEAPTCTNTIGNMVGASLSTGFPTGCAATSTYDVWYKFSAQTTNPIITLSSLGANIPGAALQLFSGACATLTSLACGTTSITSSGLTVGTTYYVRVYSNGAIPTSAGSFNICVTSQPPSNDDCAGAILLTSSATCTTTTGTIYGSTLSTAPLGCAGTVVYDVWYSFVAATVNPTITMSSVGSAFTNAKLQLFSGSCGSLTSLSCGTTSIAATGLTVGTTYYVRVYSSSGTAPTTTANTTFKLCITDNPVATVDYGKSYVNVTKGTAGGTIEPGDVLEIRATFVVKGNTAYAVSFSDNIPANTTFIPGSIKILTNEGKTYKAFTDATGDDAGSISGSTVTINLGSTATSAAGGTVKNTDKPSFYGGTAILIASYRVTVNIAAPYLSKVSLGLGTISYSGYSGGPTTSIIFPKDTALLYSNYGICSNTVGANSNLSEFGGTFGSGKNKNRFASSKIPTNYTDTILGVSTPQDYYYGITNNTSTGNASTPTGYSTLNTWAYPDNSTTTHRVFNLWDIIGDHTGATNPALGNPAADTITSSTGGYMVTINSSFRTDTAFLDTVKNLCPNTYYQYSAWFRNLCSKCACDSNGHGAGVSTPAYIPTGVGDSSGVHPDLTFNLNGYDYYTTGDIPYTGTWVQKGFTYKTGPAETQLIINIRNNAPGGGGNDWAIDDIGVASCSPNTTLSPDKPDTLCMGADDTVRFKVSSYFNNYTEWKLETSVDNGATWTTAGTDTTGLASTGSTTPTFNPSTSQYEYLLTRYYRLNLVDTTVQYRLTVATASSNLNNPDCDFATTTSKIVRTFNCQYILPTTIVFHGQLISKMANLNWVSSTEVANTVYIVQRSSDGVHYADIGTVYGNAALTGSGQYNFVDPQPVSGREYYRIIITSAGYQKFSSIVLLSSSDFDLEIKSLINPFSNTISFDLIVPQDKAVTFIVTDSYGRKIRQQSQQVEKGVNAIRIPGFEALQSGVYSLQVFYGDKILTKRVLKLEQ